jgi:hypothetical protein
MARDVDYVAVWCPDEEPAHPPRLCRQRVHDLVTEPLSFFTVPFVTDPTTATAIRLG